MPPISTVAGVTVVILLAATVSLIVVLRRTRRRAAVERERVVADHTRTLADQAGKHGAEIHKLTTHLGAANARTEAVRAQLAKGVKWDASSRHTIARICSSLGLDAVIATNVVFLCEAKDQSPFVAQIDHIVLTEHGCLIIENKGWSGVVIDGVPPARVHPTIGLLVKIALADNPTLEPPFAIQLATAQADDKHLAPMTVRLHLGKKSPAKQVRAQAERMKTHFENRGVSAPYFNTCVYYSNSRAQVHHSGTFREKSVTTHLAGSPAELSRIVSSVAKKSARPTITQESIEKFRSMLSDLGAEIEMTGRFTSPAEAERRHTMTSANAASS